MNPVLLVAQREVRVLFRARPVIGAGALVGLFIGATPVFTALVTGQDLSRLFIQGPVLGVFLGYLFSQQAFLREKQDGTIETVLSSPLTLRAIWAGKVLGAGGTAAAVALLCTGGPLLAAVLAVPVAIPVTPMLVVHLVAVVPLATAVAVGLLGLVQLLLGLRENQVLNLALVIGLVLLLSVAQTVSGGTPTPDAGAATILVLVAALALLARLVGRVDRERIVRTIA
ncbi:MAG TPA: ABC transporter permease subunit [Methanoregulaceae archaeon]|nr:ABC transporter permease subunit [Methanoregulaceae archaeon]HQJ87987.1 ABC transporter permease subunit [Methanoregulaceae archaeon]